ncbi:DUF1249 domain-containing protein [Aestuariibacter halophilus]|uniref:DUF1249 domain-containing protein n=1 Tax=Fluctibacter halophilus TaxID=226011 RepID=A0ABS8GDR2_9ALTE|nr:DUF1249 domain-containing protein [Aestuariibacter halophilus]MCC2617934.1 DUF1249 domain-containing protein [Aestuariibacter halophilus]
MTGVNKQRLQTKYVPHLPTLLAVCEVNYARLLRLLPDCDSEDLCYRFSVNDRLYYQIRILDSSRYTSTLECRQITQGNPGYLNPVMQVRMYHDAQMAEVLKSQHIGALKASYAYPNQRMHQRNEKEMVNRFLAEWLVFCQNNATRTLTQA